MKTIRLSIIFMCSIFQLSACSYTTQSRSISPYFDGILKFNDVAIHKAKIILSLDSNDTLCHKETSVTHTDKQGKFSINASKQQHTYKPFLNYQLDEWVVCAIYNNERYTLYANNRYAPGNVTESVYLNCDLANRPLSQPCLASH